MFAKNCIVFGITMKFHVKKSDIAQATQLSLHCNFNNIKDYATIKYTELSHNSP